MTETDDEKPPKYFLPALIVGVVLAMLAVAWGSWQQSEYETRAKQHAAENAWHTDKDVQYRCVPLPPLDERNCAIEARREQARYEHDQQDLAAQQTSALWTAIMGSAAVVGVVLSILGVWLVYTTFGERFRLMGVVTVLYRITTGEEGATTVPFFVHLGQRGFETKGQLRSAKELPVRVTRLTGAEQAT